MTMGIDLNDLGSSHAARGRKIDIVKTLSIMTLIVASFVLIIGIVRAIYALNDAIDISSERPNYLKTLALSHKLLLSLQAIEQSYEEPVAEQKSRDHKALSLALEQLRQNVFDFNQAADRVEGDEIALQSVRQSLARRLSDAEVLIEEGRQGPASQIPHSASSVNPAVPNPDLEKNLLTYTLSLIMKLEDMHQSSSHSLSHTFFMIISASLAALIFVLISLWSLMTAEMRRRQLDHARNLAENKFRAIFNSTFQFIGLLDTQGNLLDANDTALQILREDPSEILGRPFWEAPWWRDLPFEQERLKEATAEAARGKFVRFEANVRTKQSDIIIDFSMKPLYDASNKVIALIPEGRDITERKRAEEDLRLRAEALAKTNQELEQLAYVASHDLQGPLRDVASYTGIIERRYFELLDDKGKRFISFAVDGASRMQALINDLLEFLNVGRLEIPLCSIDTKMLVESLVKEMTPCIKCVAAQVTVGGGLPVVEGAPFHLRQVFYNLLTNALKFRHKDRPIEIVIDAKFSGATPVFMVSDNGIGIAEQHSARIFRLFERLHGRDVYPGTGLGLAICKKIIESHGGKIWVESTEGIGTTFYFTFSRGMQRDDSEFTSRYSAR